MSAGLYFQYLSGRSSRSARRFFCSVQRDEHRDLDDGGAGVDQFLLERVDLVVARAPDVRRHQVVHPDDQHVLVVRRGRRPRCARPAGARCGSATGSGGPAPPRSGLPKLVILDALRIAGSHNMFDDSALACGVHALQYQQHRTVVVAALAAVGVEHLLQGGEALIALGLQRRRIGSWCR